MNRYTRLSWFLAALLFMVALPCPSLRASPSIAVSKAKTAPNPPLIVADGSGGAVVAWTEAGSEGARVQALRLARAGESDLDWPRERRTLVASPGEEIVADLIADGAGGTILTGTELLAGRTGIWLRRLARDGSLEPDWSAALPSRSGIERTHPRLVSDGAGGAIVVWEQRTVASGVDLYAQHVTARGGRDPAWPERGVAVCSASEDQIDPAVVPDGAGGAFVAWVDFRTGESADLFARHVPRSGKLSGPESGIPVSTAAGDQVNPVLLADGSGGAFVAWEDFRSGTARKIFVHRLGSSGEPDPGWRAGGSPLAESEGSQSSARLARDDGDGLLVVWVDHQNPSNLDLRANHVLASGVPDASWPQPAGAVCSAPGIQRSPVVASDGAGGVLVAWVDQRDAGAAGSGLDVYAQHLLASGTPDPAWSHSDGIAIAADAGDEDFPAIAVDGHGGAIVAWSIAHAGVQARRLSAGGLPVQVEEVSLSRSWPNPARTSTTFSLRCPESGVAPRVTVLDVSGRRVRTLLQGRRIAGDRAVTWDLRDDGRNLVSSGMYFIRVALEGRNLTRAVVVVR
jgi:hypothetical protein